MRKELATSVLKKPVVILARKVALGFVAWLVTILFVAPSYGQRIYYAELGDANWVGSGNRLGCRIEQDIPRFGKAIFEHLSGKQHHLNFRLETPLPSPAKGTKRVTKSQPPAWRPGESTQTLFNYVVSKDKLSLIWDTAQANVLLSELETGMEPTIYYRPDRGSDDGYQVRVSAVNFAPLYPTFNECQTSLLDFTLDEIKLTVLRYYIESSRFSKRTKQKLERVRLYLAEDTDFKEVIVEGHADSKSSRWYNMQLGKRRAERVKEFLIESGLPESLITVKVYGESKPIASNRKEAGRALNRRVVIRFIK